MATLDDILSPVWTLSIDGGGAIAEGVDAIKQCLNLIVRTTPGTDPLRPEFGCGLYRFVDQPENVAIPNMKKAMLDAVARWEPRVKIVRITHTLGDGEIIFYLGYQLSGGSVSDSLTVSVGSGGANTGVKRTRLVIRAEFPSNPSNLQYGITGQVNGADIVPAAPVGGFATVDALYAWVVDNWTIYGQWYRTADAIVGYLKPAFLTGSVAIEVLTVRRVFADIPGAFNYTVTVTVDGTIYTTSGITTSGAILAYLQNDDVLAQLGTWTVRVAPADFNDDFSDDFITYAQTLELTTGSVQDIEITITGF